MRLWCFIACFSLTCCLVSGQDEKYVLVGETVDFTGFSDIKESPADILWKHIGGHIVHKVVHFDSSQERSFGSYEGRVTLSWRSADLSISNLRYEDSGTYDLEISINNQLMTKRYQLKVIDKVTKPTISCEINDASTAESARKATLLCSLPSHSDQSSLKFQWSTNGKIDLGHMLKISLGGEFDDRQYSCTVNNPLTQDSAEFIAKHCYHETKPPAGIIAGVVVVVLLILLLMGFFYLKKVRSDRQKSVVETPSNSGFPKETSGSEETQGLLSKAPTLRSKHNLGHLNQRNDTPSDPSQKDSKKNKVQDIKIPFSPPVQELRKFFEQKNEKANESEPIVEEVLEKNPSDSEPMNPEQITSSSEDSEKNKVQDSTIPFSPPAKELRNVSEQENKKANESEPIVEEVLEKNPSDSEPMNPEQITSSSEDSEKNKVQDNTIPFSPPVKERCKFFEQENKKANESEPIVEEFLEKNPSDSEPMNPEQITSSSEDSEKNKVRDIKIPFSPPVKELRNVSEQENKKANESEPIVEEVLEKNPSDSEPMNPEQITSSSEGPERNKDEDNKASHGPPVAKKPSVDQISLTLQKAAENTNQQQGLDDPADSGNPNEVSNDQNSGNKKEENEFAKSTPENDAQPTPVAKENSPLSQSSPESSPKAEHKQDINSDECAMTSSGKSSSLPLEKSEDEEKVPPSSTPKKTDSETTVEEQKPALSETESEMETLQNK